MKEIRFLVPDGQYEALQGLCSSLGFDFDIFCIHLFKIGLVAFHRCSDLIMHMATLKDSVKDN